MESTDVTYEEAIEIPVYDEGIKMEDLLKSNPDCHYRTQMKKFAYEDIMAIVTKDSVMEEAYRNCSRGGAYIFVKGRKEPYLTADEWSVKKIIDELNSNPFACLSGLNPKGSHRIYAKYGKLKGNVYILSDEVLSDGASSDEVRLHLTNDAVRTLKFIHHILTKGPKKTCFFETKRKHRKQTLNG